MPAPDPNGLFLDDYGDGDIRLTAEVWRDGNRRHRIARLRTIGKLRRWGDWKCRRCGEELPLHKRADARYCSEGCRKAAARKRRKARAAWWKATPAPR